MVDFDDLKGKAESLLGEHGDQVEEGIDKLADLAGQKFGHTGQIDQAADKLKNFVDEQQQGAPQRGAPQQRGSAGRPAGKQGGGRRAGGKGSGPRKEPPRPGPRPRSG